MCSALLGENISEFNINIDNINMELNNEIINKNFDSEEILKAISNLNSNKDYGNDLICNKFIKSAKS